MSLAPFWASQGAPSSVSLGHRDKGAGLIPKPHPVHCPCHVVLAMGARTPGEVPYSPLTDSATHISQMASVSIKHVDCAGRRKTPSWGDNCTEGCVQPSAHEVSLPTTTSLPTQRLGTQLYLPMLSSGFVVAGFRSCHQNRENRLGTGRHKTYSAKGLVC